MKRKREHLSLPAFSAPHRPRTTMEMVAGGGLESSRGGTDNGGDSSGIRKGGDGSVVELKVLRMVGVIRTII